MEDKNAVNSIRLEPACSAHEMSPIKAFRHDPIYKVLSKLSGDNAFAAGFIYFFLSFGALYMIGYLAGQFYGGNGLKPMYLYHIDNLSIGLLAPIGAGLITNLYNKIRRVSESLLKNDIILEEDILSYKSLLKEFDRIYNKPFVQYFSLVSAAIISLYVFFLRENSWLGIAAGTTGVYGAVLVLINFAMILTVVYKCVVTIWFIQRAVAFDIKIKPMHPDHAGGLKDIGSLAMAVNYFLILVMLYFTALFIFDPFSRKFFMVYIIFYIFSFFLFWASLYGAHVKMKKVKKEALERLERTSNFYYAKLQEKVAVSGIFDMESADEIIMVENLHGIVAKMPVWPLDINNMIKFVSTFIAPLVICASSVIANSKEIISGVDGLKNIIK